MRRAFLTLPEPNMGFEVLIWSFGNAWHHGVCVEEERSLLQMCGVYNCEKGRYKCLWSCHNMVNSACQNCSLPV